MDPRPIGVFDSGVGGLTVLHECLVTMPHEDFLYLGDHARLPYGPRPLEEIARFAHEIGGDLQRPGGQLVVAAPHATPPAPPPGGRSSPRGAGGGGIAPPAAPPPRAAR